MSEQNELLPQEIKVGGKVIFSAGGWSTHYSIENVFRETKTQWILTNGRRFKKDSLYEPGDPGGYRIRARLMPLTEENIDTYNTWYETEHAKDIWSKICDLGQPLHIASARLEEIYAELKGEPAEVK